MIIIATDSAADFELEELQKMNVEYLPMSVSFGDDSYLENISITKDQFFERLQTDSNFPKTSQPAPSLFEELFEKAQTNGDDVIYIPLSKELSGDYQTALSVMNMVGYDRVYIIDTMSCTGGQRLLVEKAVALREEGKTALEIVDFINELRDRVEILTIMDTLEYLYRNGRISNVSYYIAQLGHIKPIMHNGASCQGKADIPAKHIGIRKAIQYIVDQMKNKTDQDYPVYVMYTYKKDNAYKLRDKLLEAGYDIPEEHIIPVGATVGAHIGPNACAVAYIRK